MQKQYLKSWALSLTLLTGTVTDADTGEALIGASIVMKGGEGTVTDFDGNFEVNVPDGSKEIFVSYVGYTTQTVDIVGKTVVNVALVSGSTLDEVLVVGYGTVTREKATGAITQISSEDFNKGAITSAQDLILGKAAGVQITSGGDPGGGAEILIRGGSSLFASNAPLVVVDGVPLGDQVGGSRNIFITILKDGSQTAIYGSRASNGVILITTKKAALGQKLTVDYAGNIGYSQLTDFVDVLDADEYRTYINEQWGDEAQTKLLGDANTDWQREIYQNAIATDHAVTLSGAMKQFPIRATLGYTNKQGTLKTDLFQRYTGALNVNPKFLDNRLQVNLNAKAMLNNNRFANRGAIGSAVAFDPTQPIRTDSEAYGGYFAWLDQSAAMAPIGIAPANPIALIEQTDDTNTVNHYILNGSVDYRFKFLPALRATLTGGYDNSSATGQNYVTDQAAFAYDPNGGGNKTDYTNESLSELLEFSINYDKAIGKHNINVLGGYSWQHFLNQGESLNRTFVNTDSISDNYANELYLLSLYSRATYDYGKLSASVSLRADASSRFSPEARWGYFPAASVAYNIVENNKGKTLSFLKLRAGYGVTGQQAVGSFYVSQYLFQNSQPTAQYQFGDEFVSTIRPGAFDSNIKWEENTTYNFGIDFSLYDGRINTQIDLYQRNSSDLLNETRVPAGSNFSNKVFTNIGDLTNSGIEFNISADVIKGSDQTLMIGLNGAFNKNEIVKLIQVSDENYTGIETGGIAGGVGTTIQLLNVGLPANAFFVYEQVYNENGTPIEGEFVDRNDDGVVNSEDRYTLEQPRPNATFGFNAAYRFGNFDLSTNARANVGNYVYNNILSQGTNKNITYNSVGYLGNIHQSYTETNFVDPQYLSDHWIESGTFFRIDHVTLGYDLGDVLGENRSLRVYGTVQNPILVTGYSGLDPEISSGIDNNIYPRARVYLLGVNASF